LDNWAIFVKMRWGQHMALFQRSNSPLVAEMPEGESGSRSGPRSAGELLRQRREALGLELDDVAAALRIKPPYLAALEAGRPDQLPGPTYASGFVRAYGDHLGLDGTEILRRFRLETAGLDAKPNLSFPMPLGERSVPGGAMLLVALILAICGYGTWYYLSTGERSRPERVTEVPLALLPPTPKKPPAMTPPAAAASTTSTGPAGSPPPEPVLASVKPGATEAAAPAAPPPAAATIPAIPAAPAAVAAPVPAPESAAVPAPLVPGTSRDAASGPAVGAETETPGSYGAVDGPARIVLQATAESWIQVRDADHSVLFTGVLKPGESYRVPDRPGLSMRAGNAGGLDVMVDGKPVPSLGPTGAVRNVTLDPQSLAAKSTNHD
jgi:cytoskeleton protein RodZ